MTFSLHFAVQFVYVFSTEYDFLSGPNPSVQQEPQSTDSDSAYVSKCFMNYTMKTCLKIKPDVYNDSN